MDSLTYIIIIITFNIILFYFHKKISLYFEVYDYPSENRKIHVTATPLTGGFFLLFNTLLFLIYSIFFENIFPNYFQSNKTIFGFFFLSTSFFLIGYYDDKFNLFPYKKLFLISILILLTVLLDKNFVISQIDFEKFNKTIFLENFSVFFTVLCILLLLNALNMFDGVNCQLGLYVLIIFIILFISNNNFFLITYIIPLFFFIFLNYKGIFFLGSSGNMLLSAVLATVLILNYNYNNLQSEKILLMLLYPGLDMFRLFIERLYRGKDPFQADKNHLHHYLIEKKLHFIIAVNVLFPALIIILGVYNLIDLYIAIVSLLIYYITLYLFYGKKNNKKEFR